MNVSTEQAAWMVMNHHAACNVTWVFLPRKAPAQKGTCVMDTAKAQEPLPKVNKGEVAGCTSGNSMGSFQHEWTAETTMFFGNKGNRVKSDLS